MKTAFASDPRFQNHATGQGHPERSSRLAHTLDHLQAKEWFASLKTVEAVRCETEWLARVHHRQLIERARASCEQGLPYLDTPDVAISAESFEVARLAAGTVLNLADEVAHGRVDNGFALVRPPGHHAEHNAALGFCLFNNIAIAARYLQDQHGLEKILIVDWDVHHGNGTQHLFEEDPSVFYVSTHQYPHYPGTGAYSETGTGAGKGATLNCPMNAGAGNETYTQAFTETILPAIDAFGPDMILISAGFDAHQADPLGSINLTTEHYAWMTRRLMECADHHCNGRILSVLEGGYDLDALALSVAVHIGTLKGFSSVEKA
ncbi:MAG TPA: histone deacetylase [Gammaproteobacteria bacterium]|nr:histone deacetylase [Gammaproteobacteria bacterium]HCL93153.1 histone deacetylase [Gammaproteobacteria bacterium]